MNIKVQLAGPIEHEKRGHLPGGSSSGSASAVAGSAVDSALGTGAGPSGVARLALGLAAVGLPGEDELMANFAEHCEELGLASPHVLGP